MNYQAIADKRSKMIDELIRENTQLYRLLDLESENDRLKVTKKLAKQLKLKCVKCIKRKGDNVSRTKQIPRKRTSDVGK